MDSKRRGNEKTPQKVFFSSSLRLSSSLFSQRTMLLASSLQRGLRFRPSSSAPLLPRRLRHRTETAASSSAVAAAPPPEAKRQRLPSPPRRAAAPPRAAPPSSSSSRWGAFGEARQEQKQQNQQQQNRNNSNGGSSRWGGKAAPAPAAPNAFLFTTAPRLDAAADDL